MATYRLSETMFVPGTNKRIYRTIHYTHLEKKKHHLAGNKSQKYITELNRTLKIYQDILNKTGKNCLKAPKSPGFASVASKICWSCSKHYSAAYTKRKTLYNSIIISFNQFIAIDKKRIKILKTRANKALARARKNRSVSASVNAAGAVSAYRRQVYLREHFKSIRSQLNKDRKKI